MLHCWCDSVLIHTSVVWWYRHTKIRELWIRSYGINKNILTKKLSTGGTLIHCLCIVTCRVHFWKFTSLGSTKESKRIHLKGADLQPRKICMTLASVSTPIWPLFAPPCSCHCWFRLESRLDSFSACMQPYRPVRRAPSPLWLWPRCVGREVESRLLSSVSWSLCFWWWQR